MPNGLRYNTKEKESTLLRASKSEPADLILEEVVSGTYLNGIGELERNVGTFLGFLWTPHWYEWYLNEDLSSLREHRAELSRKGFLHTTTER